MAAVENSTTNKIYAAGACFVAVLELIDNGFNLINHGAISALNFLTTPIEYIWLFISIAAIFSFRSQRLSLLSPLLWIAVMVFFMSLSFSITPPWPDWVMWLAIGFDLCYLTLNILILKKESDNFVFAMVLMGLLCVGSGAWFVVKPLGQAAIFLRQGGEPHVDLQHDDEHATKLAQAISTDGLRNAATMNAVQETFYSPGHGSPSDLAATLRSKLVQLGHAEYGVTMPPGEDRILIRNNNTGQAISVELKKK